eukprot:Gb_34442 [translate_table: standard]
MGEDPITIERVVLKVDEEVRDILDRAGLLMFFQNKIGFNEDISLQVVKTWNDGKVTVNGLAFIIMEHLIIDVLVLPREGKIIFREKANQVGQLMKFIKDDETLCWLQYGISQEGGFLRTSSTPVSKYQLLLGPSPTSPILKSSIVISDMEEDSDSQGGGHPLGRKSICLQKKLVEKSKVMDFVESIEEEIEDSDARKSVEVGKYVKDVGPGILDKYSTKGPNGTHNLVEDLKCHLKFLNGVGGYLTSTCTCINLLTLEITNYLKEMVSNMK